MLPATSSLEKVSMMTSSEVDRLEFYIAERLGPDVAAEIVMQAMVLFKKI